VVDDFSVKGNVAICQRCDEFFSSALAVATGHVMALSSMAAKMAGQGAAGPESFRFDEHQW